MRPTTMRYTTSTVPTLVLIWSMTVPYTLAACGSIDIHRRETNDTLWYLRADSEFPYLVSDTLRCDDNVTGVNLFSEHGPAAGLECHRDKCFLPGAYALYVRLNRTMNTTVPDDVEDYIFTDVADQVHRDLEGTEQGRPRFISPIAGSSLSMAEHFDWIDFNRTSIWPTQSDTGYTYRCLDRGQAGHFSMSPIWVCVDAIARECEGVDEDVAVQACGMPAVWNNAEFERSNVLTLWNFTEVDPSSMDQQLIRVPNATIEDGEEIRSTPVWGGGAGKNSRPQLPMFAGLVMLVSWLSY